MKKILLKKLQSLTAILVLNTVPLGIAQTGLGYDAEVLSSSVVADEKRGAIKNTSDKTASINQLYFDNSLTYIQKHSSAEHSYQHQVALAMVEEAYQQDYDDLLDKYESELESAQSVDNLDRVAEIKNNVELQLRDLKQMRNRKIAEFDKQFGLKSSV